VAGWRCFLSGAILVAGLATSDGSVRSNQQKRQFRRPESTAPGMRAAEETMTSSNESGCRGALQPGLLVKDRLGTRKRITRVEGDNIFWEYVEQPPAGAERENSTPYEDFADSHFVLPQPGSSRGAA
jgi:hypothetical protein